MQHLLRMAKSLAQRRSRETSGSTARGFAALCFFIAALSATTASSQPNSSAYDIAFTSPENKGGIYVMRGDGSNVRLLKQENLAALSQTSWSPNGKQLAYFAVSDDDLDIVKNYDLPFHFPLYLIAADGSGRERALDIPVLPWVRWSPDGSRLLFLSGAQGPAPYEQRRSRGFVAVALYLLDVKSKTPAVNGVRSKGTAIGIMVAGWALYRDQRCCSRSLRC